MVAYCIPMTRSRAVPNQRRRGPELLAATTPPMVARLAKGGSSGIIWPFFARRAESSAKGMPASTLRVRSRGS